MDKDVKNSSLMLMAERISSVLQTYGSRVEAKDVNVRMVAEFAWALGVELDFSINPSTMPGTEAPAESVFSATSTTVSFSCDPIKNKVMWGSGVIAVYSGEAKWEFEIEAGKHAWNGRVLYIYWSDKSPREFRATTDVKEAFAGDNIVLGTYDGGHVLNAWRLA